MSGEEELIAAHPTQPDLIEALVKQGDDVAEFVNGGNPIEYQAGALIGKLQADLAARDAVIDHVITVARAISIDARVNWEENNYGAGQRRAADELGDLLEAGATS